jgi:serine/threonine-protein kinase HipA
MTFEPTAAFVWVWLPGEETPVVAGRIETDAETTSFNYGLSYLERHNAIALYQPELPLGRGHILPLTSLTLAGCISDAGPDAWGQRVIRRKVLGDPDRTDELGIITYLLESGSDRIGGLDFQQSAADYVPRGDGASLEELLHAADRLEQGLPFSSELDEALLHGSSVGGARPKVLLHDRERPVIAKLSSSRDSSPVVKAEAVAMLLAKRVGLDVAAVEVIECLGKDVLLVNRFDRSPRAATRKLMVSALTMLELDEMQARYATYPALADVVRQRFTAPKAALRELFSRIVFNVCVGNTDDHARNHAAFWDGESLTLTPAYDICPQQRAGQETAQAMAIGRDGTRQSQLATCVQAAGVYLLDEAEARSIVDHQVQTIRDTWDDAAEEARLTDGERDQMWERQILNPYAFYGYEQATF